MVHDLTNALVARGHEVTLFAASGSRTAARLVDQGPHVAAIPNAPPSLPSAKECVMLDRVAAMADGFDVIHCHTELYHAAVLRAHARKLVMTIHWRADELDRRVYFDHFDRPARGRHLGRAGGDAAAVQPSWRRCITASRRTG